MQVYQSHVIFRSFSDLYCEEKRQEEIRSNKSTPSSSNYSSRASSFSEIAGGNFTPYHKLSRNSTSTSIDSASSSSPAAAAAAQYYPAALYNSKMAQRESDTVTLNDDASITEHQDLSLRRF